MQVASPAEAPIVESPRVVQEERVDVTTPLATVKPPVVEVEVEVELVWDNSYDT